jgi:isoleucyl-tRNA synthetase
MSFIYNALVKKGNSGYTKNMQKYINSFTKRCIVSTEKDKCASGEKRVSYKDTLNLPQTDFPIRPNAKQDDPAMIQRWADDDIYRKTFDAHKGSDSYILHDGPPYANGHIHLGHAYNKVLKDILCKAYRMSGYHVPVTPGWDCHGLPIELKVTQEHPELSGAELKKECRLYARTWIDIQRDEFKQLGVFMDWDRPYITMDYDYEADTISAFGSLVDQGFIERKKKTVPWCFSCKTVLASAEIEYHDRKDPSIYVLFELKKEDATSLFNVDEPVHFLVWTTTPWTIPLNRAVMLKTKGLYKLVRIKDTLLVVGSDVVNNIADLVDGNAEVLGAYHSEDMTSFHAHHPLTGMDVPVIFDHSVETSDGTACVHTAPGCGPIDYEIGVKNKLEIYSPLSADGLYTEDINPQELEGMPITEGQIWVIKKLAHTGKLFAKKNIRHSYPHCWRCRNGLMFRATPQWFFDLDKHNVKETALKAVDSIQFTPEKGRNFLKATVENRWEWCLSRQRSWGVPIPALVCPHTGYTFISKKLTDFVAEGVRQHGVEYWDNVSVHDLVDRFESDIDFSQCERDALIKETDILDVWFDSGVSHYAVLYNNKDLSFPADVYLEGIDQYRGWFQSSLLTSLVLEKEPAMNRIMSHGFTVDEKGRKMSKSLGNVVSPDDIISRLGLDGLRLWVASIGHEGDAVVSKALLENVSQVFRKVRNTCRFMLSNLYDFSYDKDAVDIHDLTHIDAYALQTLHECNESMQSAYKRADFTAVFHGLSDYCAVELSSFYLDIIKDRLYVDAPEGHRRRSAQTVLWHILDTLVRLQAPILSVTSEQLSDYYDADKTESIHMRSFACLKDVLSRLGSDYADHALAWIKLKKMRSAVLKAIELKREKGDIKHSLEADVTLYVSSDFDGLSLIDRYLDEEFLKEFLIVSRVNLLSSDEKAQSDLNESIVQGVYTDVRPYKGQKCPRCWHYTDQPSCRDLCPRCESIVA